MAVLKDINQPLLYPNSRINLKETKKGRRNLLKYIPLIKYDLYRTLRTIWENQNLDLTNLEEEIYYVKT